MMFSTSIAAANNGAISSTANPAMPHAIRVTKNLNSTLHRGDCITLTLQAHTLAPYCAKLINRNSCSTAGMHPFEIAAKHKYLVISQVLDKIRSILSIIHKMSKSFSLLANLHVSSHSYNPFGNKNTLLSHAVTIVFCCHTSNSFEIAVEGCGFGET